ncbi:hypothetical protein Pmar_PMAR004203 [Perkinsus marinus ATCC 50983]|uniref:Uncharacterized protein n=1 Tax=Perkinsus marinus (strain ATCC 50983 / TXsc) TaxID=423536 RepID=C5LPL0_PERM5|nr:hypothetical protein Pmar_PMAR004203 [Perkinsus marinus ATCC 50983]EER01330.1 hypothetical protein Pmar_PMAR004203 [Perkinsus marinus ATCC 50983]|eukprot:XP_002768612.1 hypothetical protein Pmar_PMAR004203 [Perkinsus marinus ATCC 50983]
MAVKGKAKVSVKERVKVLAKEMVGMNGDHGVKDIGIVKEEKGKEKEKVTSQ